MQRQVVLVRHHQVEPSCAGCVARSFGRLRAPRRQRALRGFDRAPRFGRAHLRHGAEQLRRSPGWSPSIVCPSSASHHLPPTKAFRAEQRRVLQRQRCCLLRLRGGAFHRRCCAERFVHDCMCLAENGHVSGRFCTCQRRSACHTRSAGQRHLQLVGIGPAPARASASTHRVDDRRRGADRAELADALHAEHGCSSTASIRPSSSRSGGSCRRAAARSPGTSPVSGWPVSRS